MLLDEIEDRHRLSRVLKGGRGSGQLEQSFSQQSDDLPPSRGNRRDIVACRTVRQQGSSSTFRRETVKQFVQPREKLHIESARREIQVTQYLLQGGVISASRPRNCIDWFSSGPT